MEPQAVLLLSFGGPEGPDDVLPFLGNVLRGRNVPEERLREVARHYDLFGGVSPLNGQNRALLAALREQLAARGVTLPLYWGNRNWRPLLADTLAQMARDGVRRALVFVTSAYGSYSGCRQYREDLDSASRALGEGAPELALLPLFFDQPGFIEANVTNLRAALLDLPPEGRAGARLIFSAHSLPQAMADASPYVEQLRGTAERVAQAAGFESWELAYQSRSGPPTQPWLGPDVLERLRGLHAEGVRDVLLAPLGFVSDHMEVVYDLDVEARQLASELGLRLVRSATAGAHPAFVGGICDQVLAALADPSRVRACAVSCCPTPARPPRA